MAVVVVLLGVLTLVCWRISGHSRPGRRIWRRGATPQHPWPMSGAGRRWNCRERFSFRANSAGIVTAWARRAVLRGPALDTVATRLTGDQLIRQVIQGSGNMPAYGKKPASRGSDGIGRLHGNSAPFISTGRPGFEQALSVLKLKNNDPVATRPY